MERYGSEEFLNRSKGYLTVVFCRDFELMIDPILNGEKSMKNSIV